LAVLIRGESVQIVKHAEHSFGPLSFAVWRLIVAIGCLLVWLRLRGESLRVRR